jgi:hypothetical protein
MEVEVRDEIVRKVTVPDSGYFSSPGGIFFDVNEDRVVMVKTTNIPSLKLFPSISVEEHSVLAIYLPLRKESADSFSEAFDKAIKKLRS